MPIDESVLEYLKPLEFDVYRAFCRIKNESTIIDVQHEIESALKAIGPKYSIGLSMVLEVRDEHNEESVILYTKRLAGNS